MMTDSLIEIDYLKTGEIISKTRREKGYTIEELCDMLDIAEQSYHKWRSGYCLPTLDKLLAMSVIFETPLENLVYFTVNKERIIYTGGHSRSKPLLDWKKDFADFCEEADFDR